MRSMFKFYFVTALAAYLAYSSVNISCGVQSSGRRVQPESRADQLYYKAEGVYLSGDYEGAISYGSMAIVSDPDYYEAYILCGRASERTDRMDDAMRYYRKAIKVNPAVSKAYVKLIDLCYYEKLYSLGEPICEKGLSNGFDDEKFLKASARFYANGKGDYAKAEELYRRLAERHPSASNISDLGNMLERRNKTDEAIPIFKKALSLDPSDHGANLGLARIYMEKKEYQKAEEHLKIAALTRGASLPIFKLGRLYHATGNRNLAVEQYNKLRSIARTKPNDIMVKSYVEELGKLLNIKPKEEEPGRGDPAAVTLSIAGLSVSPDSVRRGVKYLWVIDYTGTTDGAQVVETWMLYFNGRKLFGSGGLTDKFTVSAGNPVHKREVSVPSGAATGEYKLELSAEVRKPDGSAVTKTAATTFKVE